MFYPKLVRPLLFRISGGDAEAAHDMVLKLLAKKRSPGRFTLSPKNDKLATTVLGIRFPNPVGLAAGLDKNARALPAWQTMGFGFVEIGTVTSVAQPGNPQPRMFRLPESKAIINRMGFNNDGAQVVARRLAQLKNPHVPIGISLGKSKVTSLNAAIADYRNSLQILHQFGDYFAINVSSPNTPGLRQLQERAYLRDLLNTLMTTAAELAGESGQRPKPLLVKIAPDLTDSAVGELLEVCAETRINGIIATNTTLSRDGLAPADSGIGNETGGLSGHPLASRARELVHFISQETSGKLPIIGVGGIFSPFDALRMFDAGASLVQIYTGLIYEGPGLVRKINRALIAR